MVEKTFRAADSSLSDAMEFVERELEQLGCSVKTVWQISVCVEEVFVNVAHYAYPGRIGEVTLAIEHDDHSVSIIFTDAGIPFDPLAKEDPDITLSAEDRSIGGLGIYMVKQSMDGVYYERRGNNNIFTMKKGI